MLVRKSNPPSQITSRKIGEMERDAECGGFSFVAVPKPPAVT
jgi:hypothetical protein